MDWRPIEWTIMLRQRARQAEAEALKAQDQTTRYYLAQVADLWRTLASSASPDVRGSDDGAQPPATLHDGS